MNLNIIIRLSLLSSFLLNNAMETSLAQRPAPKTYTRRLAKIAALTSCNQLLLDRCMMLTDEEFESLSTDYFKPSSNETSIAIEQNFERRFGYSIPTHPDDYKKTDFVHYLATNTTSVHLKDFALQKISKEKNEKKIEIITNSQHQEEQEIAQQEKIYRNVKAENERLRQKNKALEKQQAQIKREQAIKAREQRILEAQKKELALRETQKVLITNKAIKNTPENKQPEQKSYFAQKRVVQSKLFKQYKCQTEAQLKNILRKEECSKTHPCFGEYLSDDTAFHYNSKDHELIIFIGENEVEGFDHYCEQITKCDCNQ